MGSDFVPKRFVVAGSLILALALSVQAAPLSDAPGSFLYPAPGEPFSGASVLSGAPVAFSGADFSGTLTSSVWKSDANPFGADKLTFTYLLTNNSETHTFSRLTISDYHGWLTDVSYDSASMGVAPTVIERPIADVVAFNFLYLGDGAITPGATSRLLVVHTNATDYAATMANVINGSVAQVASVAPVPEPAVSVLLAASAFSLFRRRRVH
jgi:hypothetical protein